MSDITSEYAKALFMLSVEKNSRDEYKNALELVSDVFKENPKYIEFLSCFTIPVDDRLDAIESAFGKSIPRDVLSFLKILCEKKHIVEFHECERKFYAMNDDLDKIVSATATSAIELTENEKSSLKEKLEKLTGQKVMIEFIIDDSILGGLVVEIDGKIIDLSLKKQLKDVKDVILK